MHLTKIGYILLVIISLLRLIRTGYPNRSGARFVRVILTYLLLGLRNFSKRKKLDFPPLQISSKVWQQYSEWLIFQIKYINPSDWGNTPLMRHVTLVQTDPIGIELQNKISNYNATQIAELSSRFNRIYRGFTATEFENWLNRYHIMLNAFEDQNISPLAGKEAICEIGPGFGPVTALASRKTTKFHSFDTYEMQIVARHVSEKIFQGTDQIVYHPTNLASRGTLDFNPIEKYALIAFYSFTEINLEERVKFHRLIENSAYSIIASNVQFEGVDNFNYLENFAVSIGAKFQFKNFEDILGPSLPQYVKRHRLYLISK